MSTIIIQSADDAPRLERALAGASSVALDCEAAGFHRYSDRLCLLQLSVGPETYVIDPLVMDPAPALRPALEDPGVQVLMHGADYDLRLLDRDMGIHLRGLFDTQVAASLLGEPVLGLSPLLERHLGLTLAKKYQRADWAQRPLPQDMIEYAASDTRHLAALAGILAGELDRAGRTAWADEEFRLLEQIRWEEPQVEDPVVRVRGARKMEPRDVAALREALQWRDQIARARDRAPFRVAGDEALMLAASQRPRTVHGLQQIKGMPRGVVRSDGQALLERLLSVEQVPTAELRGFPRLPPGGPGRPTPEVEELAARLKTARNQRAEALGLARGALMSNAILLEVARQAPGDAASLTEVPGVKAWQMEALGDDLLRVLRRDGKGPG